MRDLILLSVGTFFLGLRRSCPAWVWDGAWPRGMSATVVTFACMRWSDLLSDQPTLGGIAHEKLIAPGVLLVGTVRRTGVARISGVEPLIMDGDLWLSMMSKSTKALDLARDERLVLNSVVTGPEPAAEIKIVGRAIQQSGRSLHEKYASAVAEQIGWQPVVGKFTLFRIALGEVAYIGYDPETHGQHVARWPEGVEYIRAATTPTSLGPREPVERILRAA